MDNIKTWTGLTMEESVRMAEDRYNWRKYVHPYASTLESRTAEEQNRTLTFPHIFNSLQIFSTEKKTDRDRG